MYHRGNEMPSKSKQNLNIKKLDVIEGKSNNTQFWIPHSSHMTNVCFQGCAIMYDIHIFVLMTKV
jgi:hypothetical protein